MRATINKTDSISDADRKGRESCATESIFESTSSTTTAATATTGTSSEQMTSTDNQDLSREYGVDDEDSRLLAISNLSKIVAESEVCLLFAQAGRVSEAHVKRSNLSKQSLGHGFVLMQSVAGARKAISIIDGREMHGRKIQVDWAYRNTTLHIGNVSSRVDEQSLANLFRVSTTTILVYKTIIKHF